MFGEGSTALDVHNTNNNWGGRMINRSTPMPISPPLASQRLGNNNHQQQQQQHYSNNVNSHHHAAAAGDSMHSSCFYQVRSNIQRNVSNDDCMEDEMEDQQQQCCEEDIDIELDGVEWKLELGDELMQQERERPGNPMAREMEQAGSRCSSANPTPRTKDLPQSKRHCFSSGSLDMSHESAKGTEVRRLFHDGSPDARFSASGGQMCAGAIPHSLHPPTTHGTSPVTSSDWRTGLNSAPPSPCPPATARFPSMSATTGSAASPVTPATAPRYYAGGRLPRVETPIAPQHSTSMPAEMGGHHTGSPTPPAAWRGNVGSTPPSIFYPRPADTPRGGGVSPLREVMRNWGIS